VWLSALPVGARGTDSGREPYLDAQAAGERRSGRVIALDALNAEQRAVVQHVDGPLLVLAGAGSGKTRTLTYRIAHILERGLASPHGILAITFTRKAAWEMRRRLEELVGNNSADITAATFHSLGYKMLCAEGGALGYKADALAISDGSETRRLLKRAMKETGVDSTRWDLEQMAAIIERAKDNLYDPSAFVQVKGDFFQETIGRVYLRYQALLKENNAVDYGDLIRLSVQLLHQNPSTLAFYQQLFRYVSVDEFQDSSFGQYQLIRLLVWRHRNLCCVGSPVQAIYSWRGADIVNMLSRFREDFPHAPRVVLHTNYRCTKNILNAAQQVVHELPYREELTTENPEGDPIALVAVHTDCDEANFVATEIERLVQQAHYPFEDCAVLFRTRAQGRLLEQVLMHRGLPYTLVGDFRFFERREIKDLLAYLRLIHDPFDAGALQRIINRPPRGLGPAALAKLQQGAPELTVEALSGLEERMDLPEKVRNAALAFTDMLSDDFAIAVKEETLPDLIDHVLVHSGYLEWVKGDAEAKQRLTNLVQLRTLSLRYAGVPEALGSFLADIATMGDQDVGIPMETRGVTLATVHAVKGLEFPIVFIVGLEEGIFPHAKALKTPGGIEEEQRLAYVGMTRARNKLYLSYARIRQGETQPVECMPSRFLAAIPRELLERISASVPATVTPAPVEEEVKPEVEEQSITLSTDILSEAEIEGEPWQEIPAIAPESETETEFERWLGEGQSAWNACEVERAEEIETWVLLELEDDDTDLEAEYLSEDEWEISDELDAALVQAQRQLLDYEMELAEIAYEREMATRSEPAENPARGAEQAEDEAEGEDFDALLLEYADEIAAHDREKAQVAQKRATEVSYALAE
jgi:DNA helicase-2/ATP-dependent DNA helicase PcrA